MAHLFLPATMLTLLPMILFFLCVMDAPTTSDAWGPLGHNIICNIAERHLTTNAKRVAKRLLGSRNLKDVCTWADDVRDRPGYDWTKPLHYANVKDDTATAFDYNKDCVGHRCVVGAIMNDALDLQINYNEQPTPEKLDETLKFLAHFMGDVHQPLHVGFQSDRGGKAIVVSTDPRSTVKTDLHEVWDTTIIARALCLKYQNNFDSMVRDIDRTVVCEHTEENYNDTSPYSGYAAYATESFTDARNYAYKDFKGRDLRPPMANRQLTERYLSDRYNRVVKKRLAQGGRRLAQLLNSIFDPQPRPSSYLQTE